MIYQTLADWLDWLENTRPEHEMELGLDRIRSVAGKHGLLSPAPFVITVAGTNGKGSTVALLESMLLQAGHRVGVYTSPHLIRFNERVRINGSEAGDAQLCESFAQINAARESTWLSYFEFAVLVAVNCFQKANVDIALMEVGLGGRLDATNVIEPDVSVITTVGLDHQEWLGYSIEAIAREKAGIMRPLKPVVYGDVEVPRTVIEQAVRLESALYRRGSEFNLEITKGGWNWQGLSALGEQVSIDSLPMPDLLIDNAATAIQALQFLPEPIFAEHIRDGISKSSLAGRCQKLSAQNARRETVEVVLDVAHNPQATARLVEKLQSQPVPGLTRVLIAMYSDKDHASVTEIMSPLSDEWVATAFESPRALQGKQLATDIERFGGSVSVAQSVPEGFQELLSKSVPGDRILVMGSFMTVAAVMNVLDNQTL
ncbi:MAG: bifunctional tetrahydrofolate synthase/dihydrofolate synthase [Endozoicomonas sp.]